MDSKRQSYHVSSRGAGDREEEDESITPKASLKRRIASLLREAEELKAEAQRQEETAAKEEDKPDGQTLEELSSAISVLETLSPSTRGFGAEARLSKQLGKAGDTSHTRSTRADLAPSQQAASYQPSLDEKYTLSLAASFDTRLKELETSLGLASIPLPTQADTIPKPLLPTLDTLEQQVHLLATTTPASLDSMSKRIRLLTDEADRLNDKRRAAKQSYIEMRAAAAEAGTVNGSGRTQSSGGSGGAYAGPSAAMPASILEDTEMETKISALYNTLPTIETLAPTLPAVLERLKSLRILHASAADAAARVEHVEVHSKEMGEEIAMWRQGLDKMEIIVREAEATTQTNMATVEKWVKELEQRVRDLKGDK